VKYLGDTSALVRIARRQAPVQGDLAAKSQHFGLSIADHLVRATANRLKLVVLHEEADFETAARVVPQFRKRRLSAHP